MIKLAVEQNDEKLDVSGQIIYPNQGDYTSPQLPKGQVGTNDLGSDQCEIAG
jgi:hypothetical protein